MRARRFIAFGLTPVVLTLVSLATELPARASTATTNSVLSSAKAAIARQHGVHLVVSSNSGSTKNLVVADLGTSSGEETISSASAKATIRVTAGGSYLQGNSDGLTSIVGLTATQAKRLGTKWMFVKAGTSQYSALKAGSTLAAVLAILPSAKGTTLTTVSTKGDAVYVLKWTTAATSTTPQVKNSVSIAAKGSALPVEETARASTGSGTTKFSKWGEAVVVSAPPSSSTLSYSTIVG